MLCNGSGSQFERKKTPGRSRGQSSEVNELTLAALLAGLLLSALLSALTGLLLLLARLLRATTLLLARLVLAALLLLAGILLVRVIHNRSYFYISLPATPKVYAIAELSPSHFARGLISHKVFRGSRAFSSNPNPLILHAAAHIFCGYLHCRPAEIASAAVTGS
jgi:hypothetical protein